MKADLHLHSTASDGSLAPEELIRLAAKKGFTHIALTDHDSVAGIQAAQAAATDAGITLITGIEMSCGGDKEIHILGYGFDPCNQSVLDFCRKKYEERVDRTRLMAEKLQQSGIPLLFDQVMRIANGVPGRAHVARVLVQIGCATSVKNAVEKYLSPGRCAFVPKRRFEVSEACCLIHEAGGIAVLAHPMQLQISRGSLEPLLLEWKAQGLDGIEVYHPSADAGDHATLLGMANRYDLMITGGSDFHGREVKPAVELGKGMEKWLGVKADVSRLMARIHLRSEGHMPEGGMSTETEIHDQSRV